MKQYMLHTITWLGKKKPTMAQIAKKLNVSKEDFDMEFGLVLVTPEDNTYCFMIDQQVIEQISPILRTNGPFSNPKIEPFNI